MEMHDAVEMAAQQRCRIAAGEQAVAGVEEQADAFAGRCHEPVDLLVGLDDGAHMVVEGHADAEFGDALGKPGDLPAIGRPFVVGQARALRDRRMDGVVAAARRVGIDDELGAEVAQQRQMREDGVELLVDLAVEDAAVIPAGDEFEPVAARIGPSSALVRGNLPPSSVPR